MFEIGNRKTLQRVASILCMAAAVGATSYITQPDADAQGIAANRDLTESARLDVNKVELASTAARQLPTDAPMPSLPTPPRYPLTVTAECDPSLDATTEPGAMVALSLTAPCAANTRVEIVHDALRVSARTGAEGALAVTLPAMASRATFSITLRNGETLGTTIDVPEYGAYERVGLQWQGNTGLQIHVMEFDAGYGDAGHVRADAPRSAMRAVHARGGFLSRLGDAALPNAHQAEIYTFPRAAGAGGDVRLIVEAHVTSQSCGREVSGQALQPGRNGTLDTRDLTLAMPDCDSIGDILVLKNLLRDMKIAAN